MRYNISGLLKGPAGTARTYDIDTRDTVPLDDDHSLTIERGEVQLSRTNRGLVARGSATGRVEGLICSRCLDVMSVPLTVDFEEEYLPTIDIHRGTPLPPPEDEMSFTIDENHHLDLSEAVRQNTLAALPIKPVCRPDCAGLCPQCGANLNETTCTCATGTEYRPFAALAQWLPASSTSE
jgi:uncharacterized protein